MPMHKFIPFYSYLNKTLSYDLRALRHRNDLFLLLVYKLMYLCMFLADRFVVTSSGLREILFFKINLFVDCAMPERTKCTLQLSSHMKSLQRFDTKTFIHQGIHGSPHRLHAIRTVTASSSFTYTTYRL